MRRLCSVLQPSSAAAGVVRIARRACSTWVAQTTFTRRRPSPEHDDDAVPDGDVAAMLTHEMRNFMIRIADKPPDPWFHRKSEKLVLAVLMVLVDGEPRFVPGINAEVSLPAGGSFCAERSAIVAARAQFPGISRADFAGIAVVEVPLLLDYASSSSGNGKAKEVAAAAADEDVVNPLQPCGACSEWLIKLQDANPDFRVVTYSNVELEEIEECLPDGTRWSIGKEDSSSDKGSSSRSSSSSEQGINSSSKGSKGSSSEQDSSSSSSTEKASTTAEGGKVEKRDVRVIAKLISHWPPGGKGFRRRDVVRRIPWFPVWWFDDLVKRGYLVTDTQGDPNKGTKYRVSDEAIQLEQAAGGGK